MSIGERNALRFDDGQAPVRDRDDRIVGLGLMLDLLSRLEQ